MIRLTVNGESQQVDVETETCSPAAALDSTWDCGMTLVWEQRAACVG